MFPLLQLGLERPVWFAATLEITVFLIAVGAALVIHLAVFPLVIKFTRWTPTDLDTRLVKAIRFPITLGVIAVGAYLALILPGTLGERELAAVQLGAYIAGVMLGALALAGALHAIVGWYVEYIAPRTKTNLDQQLLPPLRRIVVALVYGVALLVILDRLHVNVSPLLAGLGLSGLAVALALQPTLANLFAGTYVMTEGVITPGDFIELENGISGFVVDVGWRSTRIRTAYNNLVIIPNSRFADTIVTNYNEPTPSVNVLVTCGVSYESDLYHVERVCREVLDEIVATHPNATPDSIKGFRYTEFADSNINFRLFLQAKDRVSGFALQTALMQRLHQRFNQEKIEINYPVRTLKFSPAEAAQSLGKLGEMKITELPAGHHNGARHSRRARDSRKLGRLRRRQVPNRDEGQGDGADPPQ